MGTTVGELGEHALVEAVTSRLGGGPALLLGPGDDAAVVAVPDGRVVATTDMLVEGRHFRREWSLGGGRGHRAAAANLADVAAMGGVPTALLVGLAVPVDRDSDWVLELADGHRRGGRAGRRRGRGRRRRARRGAHRVGDRSRRRSRAGSR